MADLLETPLPFPRLKALTEHLAREHGVSVVVRTLSADMMMDRHGAVRNHVVYFHPQGAPAVTVAHELAHVLTPEAEPEHGPVWRSHVAALAGRLRQFL